MAFVPLRPPGFGDERRFRTRCTHCGQCAQVCPYGSILLSRSYNPLTSGTPRVEPERVPCWLCMRCGPACPTGALAPVEAKDAAMGLAVIDKDTCYTYKGTVMCKTCHEKCPLRNTAIVMEAGLFPVITEYCVGCGVCEYVCPADAIATIPKQLLTDKG